MDFHILFMARLWLRLATHFSASVDLNTAPILKIFATSLVLYTDFHPTPRFLRPVSFPTLVLNHSQLVIDIQIDMSPTQYFGKLCRLDTHEVISPYQSVLKILKYLLWLVIQYPVVRVLCHREKWA